MKRTLPHKLHTPVYETSLLPYIISRVFEPFVVIIATFIAGALHEGLTGLSLIRVIGMIVGVAIVPPIPLLLLALKLHIVSDWDLSIRKERVRMMIVFCFLLILDGIVIRQFSVPFATRMTTLYILWFIGFFLITCWWKISGHTGTAMLAVGLVAYWYGPSVALPFLLLLPIILWARVVGHRHTFAQTIGGIVYSTIVLLFAVKSGIL